MKNRYWPVALALAGLLAAVGGARAVEVEQEAEVSVQRAFLHTDAGQPSALYREYRSVPDGFVFDSYRIKAETEKYECKVEAKHLGQNDQEFRSEGGEPGKFGWDISYNQIPHLYSNEGQTLYNVGSGGIVRLDDEIQRDMQNDPGRFIAVSSGMLSFLNGATLKPLSLQNDKTEIALKFHPRDNWTLNLAGSQNHRYGTKATGESFSFFSVQIPEPIDTMAYGFEAGAQYATQKTQFAFRYEGSVFDNRIPNVTFDNPKRLTDAVSNPAMGRKAGDPDNSAHSFLMSYGTDLPMKSHFSSELGYTYFVAENPMQPYTINTAVLISPGVFASDPKNLPAYGINSKMQIFTQTYRLSSRALDRGRASLEYRSEIMENLSDKITFPGHVPADGNWSAALGPMTPDNPRERKSNAQLKLDYDVAEPVNVSLGYGMEWRGQNREIAHTREHQVSAGVVYRAAKNIFVNTSYYLGIKRGDPKLFEFGHFRNNHGDLTELPGLLRSDIADRNRNQGRIQVQYTPGEAVYSLSGRVTEDIYRNGHTQLDGAELRTQGEAFMHYGLLRELVQAYGADFSIPLGGDFSADGYFEFDFRRRITRTNQTTAASPATQDGPNDWVVRDIQFSDIGGIEVSWKPAIAWKASLGYDIVATRGLTDPVDKGSAQFAQRSLTPTHRMTQTVTAKATYKVLKSLDVTGRYEYQKFDIADFAYDSIPLMSLTGDGIYMGNSIKSYTANLIAFSANYKF